MNKINRVKIAMLTALIALCSTLSLEAQTVGGAVYGGGRKANVAGNATVTVKSTTQTQTEAELIDLSVTVNTNQGVGSVYGGNDISGRVWGTTTVQLQGGVVRGDVFGGGNGDYGCSNATGNLYADGAVYEGESLAGKTIPVAWKSDVTVSQLDDNKKLYVLGSVYSGGNKAQLGVKGLCTAVGVSDTTTTGIGKSWSTLWNSSVDCISGTVHLVKGYVGSVYGGGRMAPIYGTSLIDFPTTSTIHVLQDVYAGNDIANTRAAANVTDGVVNIQGNPVIDGNVFGGGNGDYDYTPTAVYALGHSGDNNYLLADLTCYSTYCDDAKLASPAVHSGSVTVAMGDGGSIAGAVFGGGNNADVTTTTLVTLTSGNVATVYGGCNKSNVGTTATVILQGATVGTLYGGNNIAGTIDGGTTVTLTSGSVTGNVFGGGNGDYDYTSGSYAGLSSPVVTQTQVTLQGAAVSGNLYGGGNCAAVGVSGSYNGSTHVTLTYGSVTDAYAGGRMASIFGYATIETPTNSNVAARNIYGGNDIAGSVSIASTSTNTRTSYTTALDGTALTAANSASYVRIQGAPTIRGDVYGGGNGAYDYTTDTSPYAGLTAPDQTSAFVDINLAGGTIARTFGGANAVEVQNATTHIQGDATHGLITEAYAGGNAATVTTSATLLLNATNGANPHVTTIFGGNNLAAMSILPTLTLTSGTAVTVYGGGNQGDMTGSFTISEKPRMSTHVVVDNSDIHITDAIYGGCRAAQVTGGTFVEVKDGVVHHVFGGNDVASTAHYAHTCVSGGTVTGNLYGGSNGFYDYDGTDIYRHEHTDGDPVIGHGTRAAVDSSEVLVSGGILQGNIYGGGLAGDGQYAYTLIDGTAQLQGQVFGAGCGDVAKIGQCVDHLGNVQHSKLDLVSLDAEQSTLTTVYGGGHAGDAVNTELVLHPTFTRHLLSLYGGGYAGHITGQATTLIQGTAGQAAVDTVYGGNNFGGYVANTDLSVVSGTYNTIYGAGNGAYDYATLYSEHKIGGACDTVPYSGHIVMHLGDPASSASGQNDDLTVNGNVYGGGNLGVVRTFVVPASSTLSQEMRDEDTPAGANLEYPGVRDGEYGSIVMNIYNGRYKNHIFGGARGRELSNPAFGKKRTYGRHQLAFAYKQLNMYNGLIDHSLYGGSEAVDDGYPWEFLANMSGTDSVANCTLRPTGVVNVMGGRVRKNAYGGGYLGRIFGSVYFNVGVKAVDSCYVWTRNYGTAAAPVTFTSYKPTLAAQDIYLQASVYNGSDWGEAGANAVFNTRGFYGGESHIFVDGKGYNTGLSTTGTSLPALDIFYSLIGSGTSTAEGDRGGMIIVRHYGEEGCPYGSKELYSIQRTGTVLLDSCFFLLQGEQDAYMSYASPDYTFNRIDTLTFRGHNTITLQDPAVYIGDLRSEVKHRLFDPSGHPDHYQESNLVTAGALRDNAVNCDESTSFCSQVMIEGHKDNKLVMENGIYMSVLPYVEKYVDGRPMGENANKQYGPVEGYMFFLAAADNSKNYVYAREKNDSNSLNIHMADGGFLGICNSYNDFQSTSVIPNHYNDSVANQLPYSNANKIDTTLGTGHVRDENYRVWLIGQNDGKRSRAISIVANSNVNATLCYNNTIKATGENANNTRMAVAHATLSLPPSAGGNYYSVQSVTIDADNGGQVKLVSAAYDSTAYLASQSLTPGWRYASNLAADNRVSEVQKILSDPNYTFGLYFGTGENFGTASPQGVESARVVNGSIVVGGANFSAMSGLVTKQVYLGNANGVIPTLEFELTYSRDFNTTIIRQVTMEVMEYTSSGAQVGPIDVTITIATVVEDFKDMDISLMAMYNEGTSNVYNRKVVLPATFQRRTVFLDGIEWYPDPLHTRDENEATAANKFKMTSSRAGVPTQNNIFGIEVKLTENVTDNIANTLGWYDITTRQFDVNDTVRNTRDTTCKFNHPYGNHPHPVDHSAHPNPLGYQLGVLDGRATAALDFTLHYNGNLVYPEDDTLGFVVLHCHYTAGESDRGEFDIRIRVKSRLHGDTIYLASRKHGFYRGPAVNGTPTANFVEGTNSTHKDYGKRPLMYVTDFVTALSIYEEGDVIAIIDTVVFDANYNLTVNGADYWRLQVIRYSGSHDDASGKDCAYRGPMIVMRGGSSFTAYHAWFNGSGNTRVKRTPMSGDVGSTIWNKDGGVVNGSYTLSGAGNRLPDTLWANAPIFTVEHNATLTLLRDVEVSNNFSQITQQAADTYLGSNHGTDRREVTVTTNFNQETGQYDGVTREITTTYTTTHSFLPGSAIGLYKTDAALLPTLRMGNGVHIHGNAILSNDATTTNPNRGAAIYNDGGTIQLGMTTAGGDVVTITHNYALPENATNRGHAFQRQPTRINWNTLTTSGSGSSIAIQYINMYLFSFDTTKADNSLNTIETFTSRYGERELVAAPIGGTLSNVFLTRTKATQSSAKAVDTYAALHDVKSDLVSFTSPLGEKTRMGITKWFPGSNHPSTSDPLCRDTIMFSQLTNTRYINAQENFDNRIFFDDSTTSYVFYHPTISPLYIYFQRCATFKQRTNSTERLADDYVLTCGDKLASADYATKYKINRDSKCSAMLDTMEYRVQGGFYPYTYKWQCAPVESYTANGNYYYNGTTIDWNTTDPASYVKTIRTVTTPYDNGIAKYGTADDDNAQKRQRVSVDSCVTVNLVMVPTYPSLDMVYRMEANDLTGNCPLPQEVDIRVVRNGDDTYQIDTEKRWLDQTATDDWQVPNPGVDSNRVARIGVSKVGTDPAVDSTRIRYLRVCKGVHLGVDVAPSWDDGFVEFTANYLQHPTLNLSVSQANKYVINSTSKANDLYQDFLCPGDVLTISTKKTPESESDPTPKTSSQFMYWDFDPQAPAEGVLFTMPDNNYRIKAFYSPNNHWYQEVTSNPGIDDYEVDYDGNVTVKTKEGLAWLISTMNGLNNQQVQEFHNKTITLAPGGDFDMSAHLWTPLGTQSHPFSGHFEGNSDTLDTKVSGIICLEPDLTYVGFFGNVGSPDAGTVGGQTGNATINQLHLDKPTLLGNNYVGGIAAVVNQGTQVTNNAIDGGAMISGAYMVGGIAAQANGDVLIDNNSIRSTDFLGNANYTGAIVAEDVEVQGNVNYVRQCGDIQSYLVNEAGSEWYELYYLHEDDGQVLITPNTGAEINGPTTIYIRQCSSNGEQTVQLPIGESQIVSLDVQAARGTTTVEHYNYYISICQDVAVGSSYTNNTVDASTEKMQSSGVEGSIAVGNTAVPDNGKGFRGLMRRLFGKPTQVPQAYVANNYVKFHTSGNAMVAGGLMGSASNSQLVNNYVYGEVASHNNAGALIGYIGNNVSIDRCYYQDGTSLGAFGGGKQPKDAKSGDPVVSAFLGTSNHVVLQTPAHGNVTNLTRALNDWALAQQRFAHTNIASWRSDLEHAYDGLPLFGQPDLIEVLDTTLSLVCDSYQWRGETLTTSARFAVRVVDTMRYIDSTMLFIFDLGQSDYEAYADSVEAGQGYHEHGFDLSADQLDSLAQGSPRQLFYTLELVDSLLNAHGCDSIVRLSLTLYPKVGIEQEEPLEPGQPLFEVRLFPNPTLGMVTVESSQLRSIEVYDAVSRRLTTLTDLRGDSVQLDLSPYASGVYYFRITTAHGVAIKKVVKK